MGDEEAHARAAKDPSRTISIHGQFDSVVSTFRSPEVQGHKMGIVRRTEPVRQSILDQEERSSSASDLDPIFLQPFGLTVRSPAQVAAPRAMGRDESGGLSR